MKSDDDGPIGLQGPRSDQRGDHALPLVRSVRVLTHSAHGLAALALVIGLAIPGAALGQRSSAREGGSAADSALEGARLHFKRGVELYKARDYRGASLAFRHAYELRPNYKVLYNLGQASVELGELSGAIDYFARYLRDGGAELPAGRRAEAEQRIASLRTRVAVIEITSDEPEADIVLDGVRIGRMPFASDLNVDPGRHILQASKAGKASTASEFEVAAGERRRVRLEFAAGPEFAARSATPSAQSDSPLFNRETLWMGLATGALAAGGLTVSLLALSAESRYDAKRRQLTTVEALHDARQDALTKARVADVVWGATLLAGLSTVALFIMSRDDERPPGASVALAITPEGSSVRVRSAF
jgi:hypothetical protein